MRFDLHIHSCLSPCADLSMGPCEIVARAAAAGMDGIALTDHQSARNAPALAECAARAGIAFLYGMEVCTAEEVHALALFDTAEAALAMTDLVYAALPKRVNDPDVFGDQPVVTADEQIVEMEWHLLAAACRLSLPEVSAECRRLGGLFVAAHIDRPAFSVFSQLGAIPPGCFDAVELSRTAEEAPWREKAGALAVTRSSDAHNPGDIARVWSEAPLAAFTVAELANAFAEGKVSVSPRLKAF